MKKFGLLFVVAISLVFIAYCVSPASKHVKQGDVYIQQGQWEQAIVEYEGALELDPALQLNDKLAASYIGRANKYNKDGDYDKAISDYEKALGLDTSINIDTELAKAYVEQAKVDSKNKDYDKAITDLTKAMGLDRTLNLNSELAEAYYNRGCTHIITAADLKSDSQKSELGLAIANLSKANELDPNIDDKLFLAAAYFYDEQYSKVITYCTEALTSNPNKAIGYYWLGRGYGAQCLYTLQGCDQAIQNYSKAINLAPTDGTFPNSHLATAYALRATLQYISPITHEITDCDAYSRDLNTALQIDPNNLEILKLQDSLQKWCFYQKLR